MSRILVCIGIAITLLYLGFLLWLRWPFSIVTLRDLPLNNLGDFLAGTVGPLALLWIILGFLQQAMQISQNAAAIKTQGEQLDIQVERFRDETTPYFAYSGSEMVDESNSGWGRTVTFVLNRVEAHNVIVDIRPHVSQIKIHSPSTLLSIGDDFIIEWNWKSSDGSRDLRITLRFKDPKGLEYQQFIVLKESGKKSLEYLRSTTKQVEL